MRVLVCVVLAALLATGVVLADALSDARKLLVEGNYLAAEVALGEAAKNPDLAPEAYYVWYQSLRERGEGERAAFKLETAAQRAGDRADWWLELGRFFGTLNRPDEAMQAYIMALTIDPGFSQAHSALARALFDKGLIPAAEAQFREALRYGSDSDAASAEFAEFILGQGRALEALKAVQDGQERFPDSVRLTTVLGSVYESMGETGKALEAYETAVKASPRDPMVQLRLGGVHQQRGDTREAGAAYRKAQTLAPSDPEPPIALAWLYLEDEPRPAAALIHARRARRLAPDSPKAAVVYAWALHNNGKQAEAIELLTASATATVPCAEAMYYLGVAAQGNADNAKAIEWLQKAAAAGAGTKIAPRAARLLSELQKPAPPAAGTG